MDKIVSVFGLGYIGLPTAAIFAKHNTRVVGVDISPDIVNKVNKGKIHFVENGLEDTIGDVVKNGFLRATIVPEPADVFIVAVPTPVNDDMSPDLSYIKSAAYMIAKVLKKGDIVILESTSPVGTTELLAEWIKSQRPDLCLPSLNTENMVDVNIAYCPERLLPGNVEFELVNNDRIIGGITHKCSKVAKSVYSVFVKGNILITNSRTAEMCKLAENSFRDVNIAFANELSMICDKLDINVWDLIKLANHHPRVNILQPGAGVGGHCIAVDPYFIISKTPELAILIETARIVNNNKPAWVIKKLEMLIFEFLKDHPNRSISDIKIACLGLAFKADIDDLRQSPAVEIVKALTETYQSQIITVEPNINSLPIFLKKSNCKLSSLESALDIADVVLLLVDHKSFKLNSKMIKNKKYFLCTKNI